MDRCWPVPGPRDRPFAGESLQSAGLRRVNGRWECSKSTLSSHSTRGSGFLEAVVGRRRTPARRSASLLLHDAPIGIASNESQRKPGIELLLVCGARAPLALCVVVLKGRPRVATPFDPAGSRCALEQTFRLPTRSCD